MSFRRCFVGPLTMHKRKKDNIYNRRRRGARQRNVCDVSTLFLSLSIFSNALNKAQGAKVRR
jgi:hypothetical protein